MPSCTGVPEAAAGVPPPVAGAPPVEVLAGGVDEPVSPPLLEQAETSRANAESAATEVARYFRFTSKSSSMN
jgi:hypothetical protein